MRILLPTLAVLASFDLAAAQLPVRCGFADRGARPVTAFAAPPSDCGYFSTSIKPEYEPQNVFDIPVVFHVIQHSNGDGFLSPATIQDQIDVLNEDFQALPGSLGAPGTDARIRFHLATHDPAGNPSNGITYSTNNTWFQDSGAYWNTLAWDTNRYLNVYSNSAAGYFGYVPDWPQGGLVGQKLDRVVVWWEAVGKAPTPGWPLNKGRTLTHEVGHYFGLDHPFVGGCASAASCYTNGDLICDTNPQGTETFGCPGTKSTCGSPDAIHNYMDYSDDPCMWEFTAEQINRMRCTIQHWRPDLPLVCNVPYGQGCAGTLGVIPSLTVDGCALPAAEITVEISGGLGGSQAFLFVGFGQAALPIGGGCLLNVTPLVLVVGPLPLSPVGALELHATIPGNVASGGGLTLQGAVSDSATAIGVSMTRGVAVEIP